MTGDVGDPMVAEFGTVAEWTAEVAACLGPEYHVPAACRGSGQPGALDWLLAGLRPGPGDPILDVGAGIGGPAAYAAGRVGVRPVLVEPEPDACRAAARLFGLPVVQADATALPFAEASVGLAWCLGVLCTAPGYDAQLAMLRELHRIVRKLECPVLALWGTQAFVGFTSGRVSPDAWESGDQRGPRRSRLCVSAGSACGRAAGRAT